MMSVANYILTLEFNIFGRFEPVLGTETWQTANPSEGFLLGQEIARTPKGTYIKLHIDIIEKQELAAV